MPVTITTRTTKNLDLTIIDVAHSKTFEEEGLTVLGGLVYVGDAFLVVQAAREEANTDGVL